ncbi:hypothetical protein [Cytobacillus oceanisediminis]|uniref:hypothetical protein n=1 Tax=Cytobacillus oceanisediminis TaxID=665099 RepID=UPI0021B57C64|nr:hypothetical protein [Cytobacillus oceanisediminis]
MRKGIDHVLLEYVLRIREQGAVRKVKLYLHAIGVSFIIHLLYLTGGMLVGYIKTKIYEPDVEGSWGQVDMLQTQVAFGYTGSPLMFLFTFLAIALISGIILFAYKKFTR